tara:strand:+ start:629 stop:1135 length:507 start_codon:yes stop_codon:yes gene_type:complete
MHFFFFFFFFFFLHTNPIIEIKIDHNFYVSTTSIVYKEQRQTLEITSQMFIDDIETLLRLADMDIKMLPDSNIKLIDELIESSLRKYFQIKINKKIVHFDFLGREYKNDIIQCYIEVMIPDNSKDLTIRNRLFFNLFNEQQNIIHFKNQEKRKSVLLHNESDTVVFYL